MVFWQSRHAGGILRGTALTAQSFSPNGGFPTPFVPDLMFSGRFWPRYIACLNSQQAVVASQQPQYAVVAQQQPLCGCHTACVAATQPLCGFHTASLWLPHRPRGAAREAREVPGKSGGTAAPSVWLPHRPRGAARGGTGGPGGTGGTRESLRPRGSTSAPPPTHTHPRSLPKVHMGAFGTLLQATLWLPHRAWCAVGLGVPKASPQAIYQ